MIQNYEQKRGIYKPISWKLIEKYNKLDSASQKEFSYEIREAKQIPSEIKNQIYLHLRILINEKDDASFNCCICNLFTLYFHGLVFL